ncbi:MAG: hypothetical protein WC956_06375, partial [bacterium]
MADSNKIPPIPGFRLASPDQADVPLSDAPQQRPLDAYEGAAHPRAQPEARGGGFVSIAARRIAGFFVQLLGDP